MRNMTSELPHSSFFFFFLEPRLRIIERGTNKKDYKMFFKDQENICEKITFIHAINKLL